MGYDCEECNTDDTEVNGFIDFSVDDNGVVSETYCEETVTCQKCGHVWKLYFNLDTECNNPVMEEHGKGNQEQRQSSASC